MKVRVRETSLSRPRFDHVPPARPRGMTMVEILVAVSIVGILAALLIPAVVAVRESGRKAYCLNNLHQIGLALDGFEAASKQFPPAAPGVISTSNGKSGVRVPREHSPQLQLLDYLDADVVARSANLTLKHDQGDAPENATAMSVHLGVFVCPSETSPLVTGPTGPVSYRANLGPSPYVWDDNAFGDFPWGGRGAFVYGRALRPGDFKDGLSNTVMMSEKLMGDGRKDVFSPRRDYWCAGLPGPRYPSADALVAICSKPPSADPPHVSSSGNSWYSGWLGDTLYNHTVTPNSRVPGCKVNGTSPNPELSGNFGGVFGASSMHGGGVHCLMGDGAVRFVKDSISLSVWRAISTRSGGETLSDDF